MRLGWQFCEDGEIRLDQARNLSQLARRKRGRAVEGTGFENRRRATYQGFESLRFRKVKRVNPLGFALLTF